MSPTTDDTDKRYTPQMMTTNRRKGPEHYTDNVWHVSKAVSLSTLGGFVLIMGGGLMTFNEGITEIRGEVTANETAAMAMEERHTTRMAAIEVLIATVSNATEDRITRETVLEMFASRDIQIKNLSDQLSLMRADLQQTKNVVDKIYREMAKK